jgi:hypothetical protein
METLTDKNRAWPLLRGKVAFLAGVNWEPVPARHKRNIKGLARRRGAHSFVTYSYLNQDAVQEYVTGLANSADIDVSRQSVKTFYALALMVVPALEPSGYAIIPLAPDVYSFVGCINGVLMNDIVGDKPAIDQALNTFIQFNPEPDSGWRCYAPTEFCLEGSSVFDLDGILTAKKLPASARFQRVSTRKPVIAMMALALVLLGGYFGYRHYEEKQLALQLNAQHEAFLQAQNNTPVITPPWVTEPGVKTFVAACAAHWQSTPLSLAGWLFSEADCRDGMIRFAYAKPEGGTVGDFVARANRVFNGEHPPYFNIPGPGDVGGYTQTVQIPAANDDTPLYSRDIQVQRMTTFAQQTRLGFTFTEESNVITQDGEETVLPWRVFSMTLKTDIPPTVLFSDMDETGVRVSAIKVALGQGRLMYQIEGKFYAQQ